MEYNRLEGLFDDIDIDMFTVNQQKHTDKQSLIQALIDLVDESLEDGDIDASRATLDTDNYARFWDAYKAVFPLVSVVKDVDIEISQNVSFATVMIQCEGFGFGTLNNKADSKELFQQFLNLVDYLKVSALDHKTIVVAFTVNDVWREQT